MKIISVLIFLFIIISKSSAQIYDYVAPKGAGDNYQHAAFSIYIPDSVTVIKGIYCKPLAGIVEIDPRRVVNNTDLRKISEKTGFAIMGANLVWGTSAWEIPPLALNKSVLRALQYFSIKSGHPEIEYAPLYWEGYSAGGWFTHHFVWWKPEIILGFASEKYTPPAFNFGPARDVPGYFFFDHMDTLGQTETFELNRKKGAVWCIVMQQNSYHDEITDRNLLDNYFYDIMKLRLPEKVTPGQRVELNTIDQTKGWLGNRSTFEIAKYDSFSGDKSMASWLPSEDAALKWQAFARKIFTSNEKTVYSTDKSLTIQKTKMTNDQSGSDQSGRSLVQANASFVGESAEDYAGFSISLAGDVNGDGLDDFLIGAPGKDGSDLSLTNAGTTYLFLGRKEANWGENMSLSNADASFVGEFGGNNSGCSVAAAGDVNGDGLSDFIIGAKGNRDGGNNSGKTYLILGKKKADWGLGFSLSQADASFTGEAASDWSGEHIAAAGDVNGDGLDDILIGANGRDFGNKKTDAGITYLILGRKAADWGRNFSLSHADASFTGESAMDGAGNSVASAGDVNGDGLKDFIIGTRLNFEDDAQYDSKTYLILGRKTADWGLNFDLSRSDASFTGEKKFDLSGYSIASAGDVNGDGLDDFLIGAYDNTGNEHFSGQAYLVLGRVKADWGMNYSLSKADASFSGEGKFDAAGFSLSPAGDINKDGLNDLLIGAPNSNSSALLAGRAYILYGRRKDDWGAHYDLSKADLTFTGEAAQDIAGFSVAKAGDVNGDGYSDMLISAMRNSPEFDGEGKIYLILGGGVNSVNSRPQLPKEFTLSQNYPNPFNPDTKINYSIPQNSFVTLKVYDILGNLIATLVNEEKPAGDYSVNFIAANLTSGLYVYELKAGAGNFISRKMALVK